MQKDELYDDSWMHIFLLSTLIILMTTLKDYSFKMLGVSFNYSILLLPVTYFLANFICKKYDYKKAVAAISISAIMLIIYILLISFALEERIDLYNISGEFCGYVVSQFMNLVFYIFLKKNTKTPYIFVLLNYLLSLIIYSLIYSLIYLKIIIFEEYWIQYFITLGIQFIICIPLSIIDKIAIRGK